MSFHKHLLLATPAYGNTITVPYFNSYCNLIGYAREHQMCEITPVLNGNDSLVQRSRNVLASYFYYEPKFTHLLFIDADIEYKPELVDRLLTFDKDIVCGAYPKKKYEWDRIAEGYRDNQEEIPKSVMKYVINLEKLNNVREINGFVEVEEAGTGFMLISRHALQKMIQAYPEIAYTPEYSFFKMPEGATQHFAFFDCVIDSKTNRYLSEDYTFCKRFRDTGGKIWCDITSPLTHHGMNAFEGDISTIIKPAQPSHSITWNTNKKII